MSKKITIAEQFDEVIAILKDNGFEEQATFIEGRKDKHLAKNTNRKPTKAQSENEILKTAILDAMVEGTLYTINDMIKAFPCVSEFSTSKVSALVKQLKDSGLVVRTENKGRAYFSKA